LAAADGRVCPSCQTQIQIGSEFFGGLFTCPACRAVYFIGFDGTPEAVPPHDPNSYQPPPVPEQPNNYPPIPTEIPSFEINPPPLPTDFQAPLDNQFTPIETPPIESASGPNFSPLQDVVDFANNEEAKSLTNYTLTLSGLDSVQSIQTLKDVLIDSKIRIRFEDVKPQIKNGQLRLEKLDPAQAAVLAFRLRPLQLEMKWEQTFK
jgi:hypothetical protein